MVRLLPLAFIVLGLLAGMDFHGDRSSYGSLIRRSALVQRGGVEEDPGAGQSNEAAPFQT